MQKFLSVFEKGLFWLLIFLISFIILFPKLPLYSVSGTFVAVRIEDLVVAVSLGVWSLYLILSGKIREFFKDRLYQAMALFFLIGALSVFSAVFVTHTALPHLSVLHLLRRVELILLLPLAYTAIKTKKQIIISLMVLSGVLFTVNLYALGQEYLDWPLFSTTNSEFAKGTVLRLTPGARVNSSFAGHYDLAIFLMMSLVMISALIFLAKGWLLKTWLGFLASLSFMVLVMTAARQSFAAVLVGAILSLILTGKKVVVLLILVLAVAALAYPSQLRDRFFSTITVNLLGGGARYVNTDKEIGDQLNISTLPLGQQSSASAESTSSATPSAKVASDIAPGEPIDTTQLGVYRSFEIRFKVEWPRAIRAFIKNPVLGTGYSSLGLATDNDVLRSLGEVGILGTLAFVLFLIEVFKRIRKEYILGDRFVRFYSAGTLSVIVAFSLNGLFIDVFEASKIAAVFWILLGIALAQRKFR